MTLYSFFPGMRTVLPADSAFKGFHDGLRHRYSFQKEQTESVRNARPAPERREIFVLSLPDQLKINAFCIFSN